MNLRARNKLELDGSGDEHMGRPLASLSSLLRRRKQGGSSEHVEANFTILADDAELFQPPPDGKSQILANPRVRVSRCYEGTKNIPPQA
jgi:hypothetical protein